MPRPQNVQSPAHRPAGRVRGELLLHYIGERIIYGKPHRTESVSYTHLDVDKRQQQGHQVAVDAARAPAYQLRAVRIFLLRHDACLLYTSRRYKFVTRMYGYWESI